MTDSPAATDTDNPSIHANAVIVGRRGILVRGDSGTGKSTLSLALIEAMTVRRRYGCLVADDYCRLALAYGRLIATAPEATAGLVERRGLGIVTVDHRSSAVIGAVIDLLPASPPRLPEEDATVATILGLDLPRLALQGGHPANCDRVLAWLDRLAGYRGGSPRPTGWSGSPHGG